MEVLGDKHIAALAFIAKESKKKSTTLDYFFMIEKLFAQTNPSFLSCFYNCVYMNKHIDTHTQQETDIIKSFRTISRRFSPLYIRDLPELGKYLIKNGSKKSN